MESASLPPLTQTRAFAVHVFTAAGAALALAALIYATRGQWAAMFFCLGIALVIDGVDGTIARRFKVADLLPRWSGDVLDLVVDFATYVFVPAYAIAAGGLLPVALALVRRHRVVLKEPHVAQPRGPELTRRQTEELEIAARVRAPLLAGAGEADGRELTREVRGADQAVVPGTHHDNIGTLVRSHGRDRIVRHASLAASTITRNRVFAPASRSAGSVCSAMLWLRPSTLGTKIIAVGHTRASICAS